MSILKHTFVYFVRVVATLFILIGIVGGLSQILNCDVFGDLVVSGQQVVCPNVPAALTLGGIPLVIGVFLMWVSKKL